MKSITIIKPDDWHLHLRDGDLLEAVIFSTSNHFQRALVMPNLSPPITTVKMAEEYKNRICVANRKVLEKIRAENIDSCSSFNPYMTIYLNSEISSQELKLGLRVS